MNFAKQNAVPKSMRCVLFDSCNLVHDTRQYQINKFNVTITILVSSAALPVFTVSGNGKKFGPSIL